jgi:lysyl-tRNA synthetase, class II
MSTARRMTPGFCGHHRGVVSGNPRKAPIGGRRRLFRLERHQLGPRIYLGNLRLHEWHLGLVMLAGLALGASFGIVRDPLPAALAGAAAIWLIAKDWRDILPRHRDTGAWRLGLHRPPLPLRTLRRADPLPTLAAGASALVGLVNLLSTLTPNISWRGHLLLQIEGVSELRFFHALAIPASIALLVTAYYLYRRRLRALWLAIALLIALGIFNLFKGLDIEEAIANFLLALLLWVGRSSFYVRHEPLTPRSGLMRIPLVVLAAFALSFALVLIAAPAGASVTSTGRESGDLLLWQRGPFGFHDEFGRLDVAVGLLGLLALGVVAYLFFRPLAAPRDLPDADVRKAANDLVRAHGSDTLAYFKLRPDKHYFFSDDRAAFLGYRIENGVLLVSGEPVGPRSAIPDLLRQLASFAERRGLRLAALGVGERLKSAFDQIGLRAFYIGDEAIVETGQFTLVGREIRKVRQSVTRLDKQGYSAEVRLVCDLDEPTFAALQSVSSDWRGEKAERGFSMALGAIEREHQGDTTVVIARDGDGVVRGFLHFVPSYGRAAMSLSSMRRSPNTPNGLTEFMIVRAIEHFREAGIRELSLNFAAFARLLRGPRSRFQRVLGGLLSRADAVFQIERLYRFNAKFFPRWEPRYLMYEGSRSLLRVALAAMWVEGQLPKPQLSVPRLRRRHERTPVASATKAN